MDDLLSLVVDVAQALGNDSPILAEVEKVKADKRFTEKVDYATKLLPQHLCPGGANPMGALHDIASAGIHSETEDQCTELFDTCKSLAFIGSAEVQEGGEAGSCATEALSIRRLEGSRWRGGRRTYGI